MTSRVTMLLPAILFACIALTQIGMARSGTLSPWKGGGYGMFAVQDSPGERFVMISAVTTQGEPVHVHVSPRDMEDLGMRPDLLSRLQAYPDRTKLNELLTGLTEAFFVDSRTTSDELRSRLLTIDPTFAEHLPAPISLELRTLTPVDRKSPGHADAVPVRLDNLSATVWRTRFDIINKVVRFEPLVGPLQVETK